MVETHPSSPVQPRACCSTKRPANTKGNNEAKGCEHFVSAVEVGRTAKMYVMRNRAKEANCVINRKTTKRGVHNISTANQQTPDGCLALEPSLFGGEKENKLVVSLLKWKRLFSLAPPPRRAWYVGATPRFSLRHSLATQGMVYVVNNLSNLFLVVSSSAKIDRPAYVCVRKNIVAPSCIPTDTGASTPLSLYKK